MTAIVGGLAKRRSWTPRYAPNARTPRVSRAKTTRLGEKVRPWRGAAIGRGTARTGVDLLAVAALAAPLVQDLVRIEAEIERVVAQEALRVDGARQLAVVAALEGAEIAGPDLRVALGAVQVDALALARVVEPLRQARRGLGRDAAAGLADGRR